MRFRQVHLDFHTSEKVPAIGARFDKKQFQKALIDGHVDSITVFSKCHHGWAYHPSTANRPHPNLKIDLLGAQLEACKEIGVNAPVYISAGYDEKEVLLHPEWLVVSPKGTETATYTKAHYHLMCYNTPYLDVLMNQVEEVMQKYNPCGVFLDISDERNCVCAHCVKSMIEKGMDPENPDDIKKHGQEVYANYARRTEEAVRKYSKTATIFHNAGHIPHGRRDLAGYDTHLELESLPTGGWGYDHFPMSAAYTRTLGVEFLGMTGKFHTTWGEFGGFKHPNALIYETGLSLACGACISIGDQLHPSGEMNEATYRLIGASYGLVEKKQPYCEGYKNISDIAVLSVEAFLSTGRNGAGTDSNVGANRILLEGKYLFDYVDAEADLSGYKLAILPDLIRVTPELHKKLTAFVENGGKLLLTGESGMWTDKDEFAFDTGCRFAGVNEFNPDYMIPAFPTANGETAYVMYKRGMKLDSVTGEVFARRQNSYFNRAWNHFSSHQHTPNDVDAPETPAAVLNGNIAYIGWNVFEDYAVKGELCTKELTLYAIKRLLGDDASVQTNLPDRGVITLTKKDDKHIVHLLFAHTTNRGKGIEVIEDAIPLYNTEVSVKLTKQPERVYLAPEGEDIPFEWDGTKVKFTVPKFVLHQLIAIE
ncbi:MAG: beta-galactosidase trimerization domain-containing protein [Clostridia bacterium]|nr:beta-galactosidase trimerization domain-containing protein [Clostridia bacterium]